MEYERSNSQMSSSILFTDSVNEDSYISMLARETLLNIDYIDGQLLFQWDLTNIPVQRTIFMRHVFVFEIQTYTFKDIIWCCEKLYKHMKLGDMFKVVYSDGSMGLNWTEKTLEQLNTASFKEVPENKSRLLKTMEKVFSRLSNVTEPVSVGVFSRTDNFLTLQNEKRLIKIKRGCSYSGMLSLFAEGTRQDYSHQDLWLLRHEYTLYEGCRYPTIEDQLSQYFYILTKLRAIEAEISVEPQDSLLELQSTPFNTWVQEGARCTKKLYGLNNFSLYCEKLTVGMVQLPRALLNVNFSLRLLDNTMLTAGRSFYIRSENSSETTDMIKMPSMVVPNSPFFSQNKRYFRRQSRLFDSKIKLHQLRGQIQEQV